jgi:hypothetical protein
VRAREKRIECKALTSFAFAIDIGTNALATKVVVSVLKPLGCQSDMLSRRCDVARDFPLPFTLGGRRRGLRSIRGMMGCSSYPGACA